MRLVLVWDSGYEAGSGVRLVLVWDSGHEAGSGMVQGDNQPSHAFMHSESTRLQP